MVRVLSVRVLAGRFDLSRPATSAVWIAKQEPASTLPRGHDAGRQHGDGFSAEFQLTSAPFSRAPWGSYMRIVEQFPQQIRMFDDVRIPLSDGVHLAARIWRPVESDRDPVPAILEYLPYRRRDGTAERDYLTHPYFAGHGYAAVRVDIRGSGDSDGVLLGEYLKQEQDDAVEIIAWLAAQPWCSGSV